MAKPTGDSGNEQGAEGVAMVRSPEDEPLFVAEGIRDELVQEVFDAVTGRTHADPVIGEQLTWVQARTLETLPKVKIRAQDGYTEGGHPFRAVVLMWSEAEDERWQINFCFEPDEAGKLLITHPDVALFRRVEDEAAERMMKIMSAWLERRREALAAGGSSVEEELEWCRYSQVTEKHAHDINEEDVQSFVRTLRSLTTAMVHSSEQSKPDEVKA